MIRLGAVDFDTSHVVEFTRRLNRKDIAREQWVEGAEVVLACPGESKIMPGRIPGYKQEMEKLGVTLVEQPTDMIGKVEGMLITSQEGGAHLERARPFLEAGIPCFVDKPFTCSTADARALVALARQHETVLFSSSALRYASELPKFLANLGSSKLHGVVTYGPAPLHEPDPKLNPGLYQYGIHAIELLYTLMGPGCQRVTSTHEKGVDVVTGQWHDGRLATMRGIRAGKADYGFLAFSDTGVANVAVSTELLYRNLLVQVVEFFTTRTPPIDPAITIEIVAFIEAANRSGMNHGAGENLAVAWNEEAGDGPG